MTTLNHFDVRRVLLNMNTKEPVTFGAVTVRFFKNLTYNRWQIDQIGLRTSFSYKLYPDMPYVFGTIDQIGERNAALAKATSYVIANYQGEKAPDNGKCPVCKNPLTSRKQTYCGPACRVVAYQKRQKAKAS